MPVNGSEAQRVEREDRSGPHGENIAVNAAHTGPASSPPPPSFSTVALRGSFEKRSDRLFYGLGPDSRQEDESRYANTIVDAGPIFELGMTAKSRLRLALSRLRSMLDEQPLEAWR